MANFMAMTAMPPMPGMATTVTSFDPSLVALSFVIAVFGSFTGLQSARRAHDRPGRSSVAWLVVAAISIGGGAIWSMHFIGMLAYRGDVSYSFDITRTLLSLIVAIVASGIGFYIAGYSDPTIPRFIIGGFFMGLGVAGMHYLGMSAMRMNSAISYRPGVVGLSLAIAVVAATVTLFFAFRIRRLWAAAVGALVMGVGICAMHYTGMIAATFTTPATLAPNAPGGVNPLSFALPVFGIASVLLLVLLCVGLFEDVDQRAEATAMGPGRLGPGNDVRVLQPR